MTLSLGIIGGFSLLIGGLWFTSMRLTPHRGVLRVLEKVCVGVVICYLAAALLRPFGIAFPQSPVSAALAGVLGLPGSALAFWIGSGF